MVSCLKGTRYLGQVLHAELSSPAIIAQLEAVLEPFQESRANRDGETKS
jgi:hypothetical protein